MTSKKKLDTIKSTMKTETIYCDECNKSVRNKHGVNTTYGKVVNNRYLEVCEICMFAKK